MMRSKGNVNGISDMIYCEDGKLYEICPDKDLQKLKEDELKK